MPTIAIVRDCASLHDAAVARAAAALQIQVSRDFAPAWGIDATVIGVPAGQMPPAGAWQIALLDHSDQVGDLGYHETTAEGLPLGKVFVADDLACGCQVSVTLSHELLEMLGDPDAAETVSGTSGLIYPRELCDAVEDDGFAYEIDGVALSDFLLPAYFAAGACGPYDFRGVLKAGLPALARGGYASVYDPREPGAGWKQVWGEASPIDRGRLPRWFHRRRLRATTPGQRRRSTPWA